MPRFLPPALALGVVVLLGGCAGFGDFLTDTHTFQANKNRPIGDSETIRRVAAKPVDVAPLTPEPGNIWPTEQVADPTLLSVMQQHPETEQNMQQIQQQEQNRLRYQEGAPSNGPAPTRAPHPGSSSPPGSVAPALQPLPSSQYQAPPVSSTNPSVTPPALGPTVTTPSGTNTVTGGGAGYSTTTPSRPGGGTAIVVPNGNGTSTVINPDGTIQTIPSPK